MLQCVFQTESFIFMFMKKKSSYVVRVYVSHTTQHTAWQSTENNSKSSNSQQYREGNKVEKVEQANRLRFVGLSVLNDGWRGDMSEMAEVDRGTHFGSDMFTRQLTGDNDHVSQHLSSLGWMGLILWKWKKTIILRCEAAAVSPLAAERQRGEYNEMLDKPTIWDWLRWCARTENTSALRVSEWQTKRKESITNGNPVDWGSCVTVIFT